MTEESTVHSDEGLLSEFMTGLNYQFDNLDLLLEALTHSSYRNEHSELGYDNERFEFLGDAILGAVMSDMLMKEYPEAPEGVLTRYKSVLVSEQGLCETADRMDLGRFLRLGRGEEMTGGRSKTSVLSNAVEAVVAAVFLDGGFTAVQDVIGALYSDRIADVGGVEERVDFKTKLQEWVQLTHHALPQYAIVNVSGPDHERVYSADVSILGESIGTGTGRSKKEAEQQAAAIAYEAIVVVEE